MNAMRMLLVIGMVASAAAGCRGPAGRDGAEGLPGPRGPLGPVDPPPEVLEVHPLLGSPSSILRIRGDGFSTDPGGNRVTIDGMELVVLSESPNELRVQGGPASTGLRLAELTVEADGRTSNPVTVERGPAGAGRPAVTAGLVDPRGLALDPVDGSVLVFDAGRGVLRVDGDGVLAPVHEVSSTLPKPLCGVAEGGLLQVGESRRIVSVAPDGTVTARVTGLAEEPTAMAADEAGNVYWSDGGTAVGKLSAGGAVDPAFATVPAAAGMTRLGANLYVSDPAAGAIHRIALPGGATTADFVTGYPGIHGLASDGTDVIAAVPDAAGRGAIRITAAGTVSDAAPERPLADAASASGGVVYAAGAFWSVSTVDRGIDRHTGAEGWRLAAANFSSDGHGATYAGDRSFIAVDNRCVPGSPGGALVESLGGGASRLVQSGVCAGDGVSASGEVVLLSDARDGQVTRVDVTSGDVDVLVPAGTVGTTALTLSTNGAFFMASSDGATSFWVSHHDVQGGILSSDVTGGALTEAVTGLALSSGHLFVSTAVRVLLVPLDGSGLPSGAISELVPPSMGFSGITGLAPDGENVLFHESGGGIFRLHENGAVTFLFDGGDPAGIARTAFGDLLFLEPGVLPIARLL